MATFGPNTPILRVFDVDKTREFYLDFLGFKIEFEHRFGDNFPIYMGVAKGACRLHLSEHHGDACPGAQVRIETNDIDSFARELSAKDYKFAKPGTPHPTPWQTRELTVSDPFGNRLTWFQRTK